METYPSAIAFEELARQGNLIPVYMELAADFATPVSLFARLRGDQPSFLFESIVGGERIGRYSFAGTAPRKIIAAYPEETLITTAEGTETIPTPPDPLALVEEEILRCRAVSLPDMPPFLGGAVGYLGHDYVHCVEPSVPFAERDLLGVPLCWYGIFDEIVIFDHVRQVLRLCVHVSVEEPGHAPAAYEEARQRLSRMWKQIQQTPPLAPMEALPRDVAPPPPEAGNFTRAEFEAMVERVKEYIRDGDVIQVVGSQRFEFPADHEPLDLYRALRIVNPSPYMFILETGESTVVGASPEVHVRSIDNRVEIRPIAGTRPRGASEEEDIQLEAELLADAKERAEHLMLVDLARNDIGRVCQIGSVEVKDYAFIERYSHVMHIVSQVEGTLAPEKTAFDLMRHTFPAGTLTGAPKVRAMQIIAELERERRGVYGGALGYFSFAGNLDCCIAIRTALFREGKLFIQAGAGLVADSQPASEYQETLNKARGVLRAVELAKHLGSTKS